MRILVTGITGQVGSAIASRFGGFATVIGADRASLDLARPLEMATRLDGLAPDVIVNAAAYTAVDRAEDEKELAFTVNATAPGAIARWAAMRAVPLVHFSTDYVFDGSGARPWREDDPTGPLNAYGASKLAGEQAVRAAGGAHLIVRTSWVYAASGTNFLRTMAKLMRERDELSVVADQHGAPTSAAMIGTVLANIMSPRLTSLPAAFAACDGVLHLTASGTTTWHGMADEILRGLKRRGVALATRRLRAIPTAEFPAKAIRPLNSRLDLTRLSKVFQIQPEPWNDLLEVELDALARAL
jgi:dTDP-4-dehydrorhamnose reductase